MPRNGNAHKDLCRSLPLYAVTGQHEPDLSTRYLIKGLVDKGSLSCMYGRPKGGKTFAAIDLAMHLASGMSWRGLRIHRTGVLYNPAEGGDGFGNRIAAWTKHRLPPCTRADFSFVPACIDLIKPAAAGEVSGQDAMLLAMEGAARLLGTDIGLVVIDTVARVLGGGDENSSKDMGALIRVVDAIRERTGAHVMLLHHVGKDETRGMRGHSSLLGAVDTAIEVDGRADNPVLKIKPPVQKDHAGMDGWEFKKRVVTLGRDADGDEVTSVILEPQTNSERPDKLTFSARRLLDILRTLISANRTNGKCPADVVSDGDWRAAARANSLSRSGSPAAEQKAYRRACDELRELGYIADSRDGWVLTAPDKPDKPGHL